MIWLQFLVVIGAIVFGVRLGGVGLGVMGGLVYFLTFVFKMQLPSLP